MQRSAGTGKHVKEASGTLGSMVIRVLAGTPDHMVTHSAILIDFGRHNPCGGILLYLPFIHPGRFS